jgi:hypothetical protein
MEGPFRLSPFLLTMVGRLGDEHSHSSVGQPPARNGARPLRRR